MARADAKLKLGPQELKVNTFYKVQVCWHIRTRKLGPKSSARIAIRTLLSPG